MASRITVERPHERPAWEVRVDGQRVGLVWRERGQFRAIAEGGEGPLPSRFSSRDAAARALARRAGFADLEHRVAEEDAGRRRGRP